MINTLFILALQEESTSPGLFQQLAPWLLIFVVLWFFMIRPQVKRQKELKTFQASLQKGDRVVTNGGIFGKIIEISDYTVIIEVENQGRLKVLKNALIKDTSGNQQTK
ncbi:MAG: preprotein translocase subunit YajC [Odoribacteraceae bacterium]|jgi:preprotein translocase subunit YajC|nr:preprotein translocase subunit YajC [Odoribacteraceae bacterium]